MVEIIDIIFELKKKKELRGIPESIIEKIVMKELKKRPYLIEKIEKYKKVKELKRDEEFMYFFKEIRKILHETFGLFSPKDLKKMYEIIYSDLSLEEKIIELLMLTNPTKERLNFYKEIYQNIFIEEPDNIMDLASGLNPISIYFSENKPKKYYYIDISEDIININDYILKEMGVDHEGYILDISEEKEIIYKHYQYIFLWKTIPVLEKIDFYLPRRLISKLDFDYLIISFPQKSIGKMRNLGKAWIYWMRRFTQKLNYKIIKEFQIPYEYFFIIKK